VDLLMSFTQPLLAVSDVLFKRSHPRLPPKLSNRQLKDECSGDGHNLTLFLPYF
jgi:hypothetical protein